MTMNSSTPAILIRSKDLAKNVKAFAGCLELLPKTPKTVLDIRYGLGGWAKELRRRYPKVAITGYEADPSTYNTAFRDSLTNVYCGMFDGSKRGYRVDLLVADFNTLTTLKRKELEEALAIVKCQWLIFTDVACSKLHLNYRSYGLEEPDLNAYWDEFDVEGYRLAGWAREHHAASTAIYQRKEPH